MTCSAVRSTRRSQRAVFGSLTVKAWLRRNETRGWIHVRSKDSGLATPKNRRIFSTWVPLSSPAAMVPYRRRVTLSNLRAHLMSSGSSCWAFSWLARAW